MTIYPTIRTLFTAMVTSALSVLCSAALARNASIALYDGKQVASVVYDESSGVPVSKAAVLLSHDLVALSGRLPRVTSDFGTLNRPSVVIGLANAPQIAALLRANHIGIAPIAGKWETYGRAVIPSPTNPHAKMLIIFGSDVRGTIWGVIDLTREMGVSPWEWWADVKITKTARIAVNANLKYSKEPSVKYRGFFINSGNLSHWAANTFDPAQGGLGPKTYERVFELMWRLKANMLWPGMGAKDPPFNAFAANYDLARDYAIVRGTSHVEMLLRTNGYEWDAKTMGPYNWLTNRQRLIDYWTGDVEKFGQYDNLYTVGMRGADDFPMQGADTPEKMADVLNDVITQQRKILGETLHKPANQIPQVFTPYKEITAAYNTGRINLPGDITIVWPEDNFGYIMRFPAPEERKRPGGAGVYYHATFWGAPAGFLWLGSTDPSLMWEEMTKAYHFDMRELWVLNVGSIKPVEFLNEFFLAMAFDIDAFAKPKSVQTYLHDWAVLNFGHPHADEIASIMWRYYKLAFDRNPEFMAFSTTFPETSVQRTRFNSLDFGDENARRADAYRSIMAEADKLMAAMPDDRKSAFFELVQYTVNTGGNLNLRQLDLDKSITYGLQHRASANVYDEMASIAQEQIVADTRRYNEAIENGKWNKIVTDYPHALPNYEQPYVPSWRAPNDWSRCGVQVEGGGYFDDKGWWTPTLPTFSRELGARGYYLDVFTELPVEADWSAEPKDSWIRLDHRVGHFSQAAKLFEQRIRVAIDWTKAPAKGEGIITVKCTSGQQPMDVHVRVAPPLADQTASFIDAQGVVSMYATHADAVNGAWRMLDGVGHTGAALESDLDMAPINVADATALAKAPRAVYRFATLPPDREYSFPNYVIDTVASIKAFALPTFPIQKGGHSRIAVALDGGPAEVLDFSVEYYGAKWRQNVLDNVTMAQIIDQHIAPGAHTLTVTALDPGVVLDRFEIAFAGASPSYGPVPETRIQR